MTAFLLIFHRGRKVELVQVACNLLCVPTFLFPVEDITHDNGSFFIHDELVLIIGRTHIAEYCKVIYELSIPSLHFQIGARLDRNVSAIGIVD